jgi:hypothetical protein
MNESNAHDCITEALSNNIARLIGTAFVVNVNPREEFGADANTSVF